MKANEAFQWGMRGGRTREVLLEGGGGYMTIRCVWALFPAECSALLQFSCPCLSLNTSASRTQNVHPSASLPCPLPRSRLLTLSRSLGSLLRCSQMARRWIIPVLTFSSGSHCVKRTARDMWVRKRRARGSMSTVSPLQHAIFCDATIFYTRSRH